MTYEQKLMALSALGDCPLLMRRPGDWYVAVPVEIGGNGMLESPTCSESSPETAVETMWNRLVTDLPPDRYLVLYAMLKTRRHVKWNGFMWIDLKVD